MTSTDRLSNVDSLRTITDRLGQTLILGDARVSADFSMAANIVAAAAGAAIPAVPFAVNAVTSLLWQNASFGLWAVYWSSVSNSVLSFGGASVFAVPFSMTATSSFQLSGDIFMTGEVAMFAGPTAPAGWLECDGTAVSRTTYSALFAIIGTTYGVGDGSTTFNLPECRGEFFRSYDHGRGVDTGRVLGSTQTADNAPHSHGVNDSGHSHGVSDGGHTHSLERYTFTSGGTGDDSTAGRLSFGSAGDNNDSTVSLVTIPFAGARGDTRAANAGTGVSVNGATTGISTQSAGTEGRPRNIAFMTIIKF
jgi:microcystin-dependent protein